MAIQMQTSLDVADNSGARRVEMIQAIGGSTKATRACLGDKIKVTVRFRGREMQHQELGARLMDRVKADLQELAIIEQHPRLEMRQSVMVMAPKKKV